MQNSSTPTTRITTPKPIRGGNTQSTGTKLGHPNNNPPGKKLKRVTLSEHVEIQGLKSPLKVTLPEGGPSDREEYVEYALDMLIHNLIGSGQLQPSQAHLVKTPELRAHISELVERVEDAHKIGLSTQISSKSSTHKAVTKWALQPNSLPITIITDKDPNAKSERKPNVWSTPVPIPPKKRTNVLSAPLSIKPKQKVIPREKLHQFVSSPEPPPKFQRPKTSYPSSPLTRDKQRPTSATNPSAFPTESTYEGLDNYRFKPAVSIGNDGGFRAKFDMRGFENEEISLDLNGRKLTVTGTRPRRDEMNERKTIEHVELPLGVNLDNLKVARRVDGILLIQESPMERRELI